mmetsp:Transcript_5471/g.13396  ORF Transcript_5471/g.13396 Transcript_5471/m.13396 type:complete len:620 (-) Transcript_5471:102-1961(-)
MGNHSSTPRIGKLTGANICCLSADGSAKRVEALGGTVVKRVEDATHCMISGKLKSSKDMLAPAVRKKLLLACKCHVPVVGPQWLDQIAKLPADKHWSEAPLEAFTPAVMAEVEKESKRMQVEQQARLMRQRKRRRNNVSEIANSLDESWAFLMREQPAEVEGNELRRAIELSLLDTAVTLRQAMAPGSIPTVSSRTPEQVLGVPIGAPMEEIKEAFKRRALEVHPDKGGRAADFEALLLAYRTLTRGAHGERTSGSARGGHNDTASDRNEPEARLAIQQTMARDEELREHRCMVEELFERHGAKSASFMKKQEQACQALGLSIVDLGASNWNEQGQVMTNQCFYLSLAGSYLGLDVSKKEAESLTGKPLAPRRPVTRLEPKDFAVEKTFVVQLSREAGSLGLQVSLQTKRVQGVSPGTVSDKAGVRQWDRIAKVNGQAFLGHLGAVIAAIPEPSLQLTIERPAQSELPKIIEYEESSRRELQASLHDGASDISLLRQTSLRLKRILEAAVLRAHPEWADSRVGEEVQAFSDFLFYVLDSPTLISELAIAIFDSESGFVEIFMGSKYFKSKSADEQRANLLTIRYVPGHYQALVGHARPTLTELCAALDEHEVLYVITDG